MRSTGRAFVLILVCRFSSAFIPGNSWKLQSNPRRPLGSAAEAVVAEAGSGLAPEAVNIIVNHLNSECTDVLRAITLAFTPLGAEASKKNALTQGSFVIDSTTAEAVAADGLSLRVAISERSFWGAKSSREASVIAPFPNGAAESAEDVKRGLMDMCRQLGLVTETARVYAMPVGQYNGRGLLPNPRFNNVPHSQLVRSFVYRGATEALLEAIADPSFPRRMQVRCIIPELNPEMDTYRVGTMLELAREMALNLADAGLRVKLCIQGSMGEGIFTSLPLSLSGLRAIMERMDWGDGYYAGEAAEVPGKISFGQVGPEFVAESDDVVMILAPQSIVGASIHERLSAMEAAATGAGKAFVLVNPILKDRPSSAGKMGVRGRGDRLKFAASFADAYHFRLLYPSSASYFPVVGAVMKSGPKEPYVAFVRRDVEGTTEQYVPIAVFEENPGGDQLSVLFGQ